MVSPFVLWVMIGAFGLLCYKLAPNAAAFEALVGPGGMAGLVCCWFVWQGWCIMENRQKLYNAKAVTRLARGGPYGIVRHPIYLANIIILGAGALYYPLWWFLVTAVFGSVMLVVWGRLEEGILLKRFGGEYSDYMKSVPGMNPFPVLIKRAMGCFHSR